MSNDNASSKMFSRRSFLKGSMLFGGAALLGGYIPNTRLLALQDKIELQFWHQWGGPKKSLGIYLPSHSKQSVITLIEIKVEAYRLRFNYL